MAQIKNTELRVWVLRGKELFFRISQLTELLNKKMPERCYFLSNSAMPDFWESRAHRASRYAGTIRGATCCAEGETEW